MTKSRCRVRTRPSSRTAKLSRAGDSRRRGHRSHQVLRGGLAGAAGTTALNAVTYLDMALRARPASSSPEQTVRQAERHTGPLPGDQSSAGNRRSGIGALLGIAAGVASGVVYGCARTWCPHAPVPLLAIGAGLAANAGSTAPMTALGVTDPREWTAESWLMDLVPHLAFGAVTALAYEGFRR